MSQIGQEDKQREEPKDSFIRFLEEHREDRAMMASLRRGFAQPQSPEVSRIVQCRLSRDSRLWLEDAYYSIAPLFALHHENITYNGNMGSHFRDMCEDPDSPPSNIERRFMQLLASDAVDLDDLLRQAVSLLKSKNIAVNWQQLLDDVIAWKHTEDRRDSVRKNWARAFWRSV